jgi:hypothetical protein
MKNILWLALLVCVTVVSLQAQDKNFNTDQLKKARKISQDEWKQIQDQSAARSKQFMDANSGELPVWADKGYTVLKSNQTLNLPNEVTALFDYVTSGGQNTSGTSTQRKRSVFKLGPGKFEIKDGIIKRTN